MKKFYVGIAVVMVVALGFGAVNLASANVESPLTGQNENGFRIRGGEKDGPLHDLFLENLAEALGVSSGDLVARLESGEKLPDIAAEYGYEGEALKELLTSVREATIEDALEAGLITEEQAEKAREGGGRKGHGRRGNGVLQEYFANALADVLGISVGHSLRRTPQMIQAEVNWINYLADGGAAASSAVLSDYGNLVEQISDGVGEYFLATAFTKAKGERVFGTDLWNQTFFQNYGREIGKMHALSKLYPIPAPDFKRYEWNDKVILDLETWLPHSDREVLLEYQKLKNDIETLPKDQENYGLIHQDAHGGNFFVDDNGVFTFFDFDDCAYSWFANDIGILFFYARDAKSEIPNYQNVFVKNIVAGYKQANSFDPSWLEYIPSFIKLREITLYGVIHRDFDVDNIDHPWISKFMDGRREKIINNIPYFDFDFSSVNLD